MNKYWFGVVLRSTPHEFDELAEASFEAGCDDGTVSMHGNVARVDFARESESLEAAIRSAVCQLEAIGCVIAKVEIDDLEALRDVA